MKMNKGRHVWRPALVQTMSLTTDKVKRFIRLTIYNIYPIQHSYKMEILFTLIGCWCHRATSGGPPQLPGMTSYMPSTSVIIYKFIQLLQIGENIWDLWCSPSSCLVLYSFFIFLFWHFLLYYRYSLTLQLLLMSGIVKHETRQAFLYAMSQYLCSISLLCFSVS